MWAAIWEFTLEKCFLNLFFWIRSLKRKLWIWYYWAWKYIGPVQLYLYSATCLDLQQYREYPDDQTTPVSLHDSIKTDRSSKPQRPGSINAVGGSVKTQSTGTVVQHPAFVIVQWHILTGLTGKCSFIHGTVAFNISLEGKTKLRWDSHQGLYLPMLAYWIYHTGFFSPINNLWGVFPVLYNLGDKCEFMINLIY